MSRQKPSGEAKHLITVIVDSKAKDGEGSYLAR